MPRNKSGIIGLTNIRNYDRIPPLFLFVFLSFILFLVGLLIKINLLWQLTGFFLFVYVAAIVVWIKTNV